MRKGVDYIGNTVVFACHDGHGNYLLSKRSDKCRDEHGTWDPGGGGVELHDTIEQTLRKEVSEEYCADVLDFEFLGYRSVHRIHNGEPTHWISLDFKVLVDPGQVRNGEPHKLDDIRWFRLDALPKPLHSQYPHFLEKYKERL
jgi:8-oxo-dGTP pyrophosphatase MutT (NUDIX family)